MEEKGIQQRGMEEAPENGKESSHSAHANGMNECSHVAAPKMFVSHGYVSECCTKLFYRSDRVKPLFTLNGDKVQLGYN